MGEEWIADVLATDGFRQVAFEVQWSPQHDDESQRRTTRYTHSGVEVVWLFRRPQFSITKELKAAAIHEEAPGHYIAHLPRWDGLKTITPACHRSSLDDFVRAVLDHRLWFGLVRHGAEAVIEVKGAFEKCWRCDGWTRIVPEIVVTTDRETIELSISDFEGAADLLYTVLPPDLKKYKVGPIKSRYSRTEGGSYLSNGCAQCDALQGRFFYHRLSHRLQTMWSSRVKIGHRWKSLIDAHEHFSPYWHIDAVAHPRPERG